MTSDLLLAIRGFRRAPGFAAVAALSLALGIGGGSAIFSLVDAVLLRPLPFPQPTRVFALKDQHSLPDVRDLRAACRAWSGAGAYASWAFDLTGRGDPERVEGAIVSGGLLGALAMPPELGRLLGDDDDRAGAAPVAVVSHRFWREKLSASPSALGSTLVLSGKSYTVVGVLPEAFELWQSHSDVLVPFEVHYPDGAGARGAHFAVAIVRLAPEVTLARAQDELTVAGKRLGELYPAADRDRPYLLEPLHERYVERARPPLLLLLAAVGLVLLVACGNFAGLLLARGIGRQRELGIRAALGASRRRLVRQQLCESVLLALLGGAAGLLLAAWLLPLLLSLQPAELPHLDAVRIDRRVLAVAFGVSLATGVVFGLLPALRLSSFDLQQVLKEGSGAIGGRTHGRLRRALVVAELALSLSLLVAAGLLLRSFSRLQQAPLGFDADGALGMRIILPEARYPQAARSAEFFRRLLEEVQAAPGVARAGLISEPPLGGSTMVHDLLFASRPAPPEGREPDAMVRVTSGSYFGALKIPLVRGRLYGPDDGAAGTQETMVNQAFVRRFFPGEDPLGKQLRFAREKPARWMTIVGVVGDVRHLRPDRPEGPAIYQPLAQNTMDWRRWSTLVVVPRAAAGAGLVAEVKRALLSLDPLLPLAEVITLEQLVRHSQAQARFSLLLVAIFALVALALAAVGIYGVVSFSVSQRTRELGLRMAMGARARDVVGLVVRQALGIAAMALPLGLGVAAIASRLLAAMLFGVGPADPTTYAGTAVLVLVVSLAASWVPARRAARIDPMTALRHE